MKKLINQIIGIDQGDTILFSDFEEGGDMWTGKGPRLRRKSIAFSNAFKAPPCVHVSLSMWDMDTVANARADVTSENVTVEGFDVVFRTWGDTRVARARVGWLAIGPLGHADDWELY
ncbi:H-type lectin domain protein [Roseovarius albus]|uniref:H-type lectin domain protein n=1 Tax=Roseovarius albus TaxID=1247867 RepID=A0A1X6YPI1_9RHOB|nr:H-type lectin domain-containing protein [Roseovarius albus]SLN27468.1 H-type lectin domain protein [Roseovarius albus]